MPADGIVADALELGGLGWPVFPVRLEPKGGGKVGKRPLVRWKDEAALDPDDIRSLDWTQANAIGVALPGGVAAVDVDDASAFEAAGLELPETAGQRTQSGGYHRLYATDGREVRQTVKEVPGADTRVGGKGFLVAWERWSFRPSELAPAPEWLYAERAAGAAGREAIGEEEPLTTRAELIALAGSLRRSGLTREDVYAVLARMRNDGRIADARPEWPWSAQDLKAIAVEAGKWEAGRPVAAPEVVLVQRGRHAGPAPVGGSSTIRLWTAGELISTEMDPLAWAIPGILPEGTTVLAARPKIGKSWLAYQTSIAVSLGSTVLGERARQGDALYLALEDGPRRGKSRLEAILAQSGVRAVPPSLEVAFEWPRIGEGCEEMIGEWLDSRPGAVVVWVDTLARIRPRTSGRRSAYEVDYEDMAALQSIVVDRGVSLGIVHHDRKAESDDFLEQVSGTHGITGAADTVMVLRRARNSSAAALHVTGRDIEERTLALDREGPLWVLGAGDPSATDLENELLEAVRAIAGRGEAATTAAVVAETGMDYERTKANLQDKARKGLLRGNGRSGWVTAGDPPRVVRVPHAMTAPPAPHPIRPTPPDSPSQGVKGSEGNGDTRPSAHARARDVR